MEQQRTCYLFSRFLCQQHTNPDYDVLFSSFTFSAQAATTYNSRGVTIQAGRYLQFVSSKVPEGMPAQVNLAVFF
jgi:hypothetical protein